MIPRFPQHLCAWTVHQRLLIEFHGLNQACTLQLETMQVRGSMGYIDMINLKYYVKKNYSTPFSPPMDPLSIIFVILLLIGKIWVYDVGESLALPGADEWGKFAHTLQDMRVNKSGNAADMDDYDKDHKGGVRHDHAGSVGVPGSGVGVGTGPGSLSSLTSLSSSPLR